MTTLFPVVPDGVAVFTYADGATYQANYDRLRLGRQLRAVHDAMLVASTRGVWLTLDELAESVTYYGVSNASTASLSARLRDLRKPRFGGLQVLRRRRGGPHLGLYEYLVLPPTMPEGNHP